MKQSNKSDQQFHQLFEFLSQCQTNTPEELKENILQNVLNSQHENQQLSFLQRLLFTRPLVAAGSLACVISFTLWSIFGNAYLNLFSGFLSGGR